MISVKYSKHNIYTLGQQYNTFHKVGISLLILFQSVHYLVSGAGNFVDQSMKHKDDLPNNSLKLVF